MKKVMEDTKQNTSH